MKKPGLKDKIRSIGSYGTIPGAGLLILFIIVLVLIMNATSGPEQKLRNLSYPYTVQEVVSSDTYILKNHNGKDVKIEIRTDVDTTFYNRSLEETLLGRTVYYKDKIIYFIDDDGEIETVNQVVKRLYKADINNQRNNDINGDQNGESNPQ